MFDDKINENIILEKWLTLNLNMSWEKSVETAGQLGGYNPISMVAASEGFVIRNKNEFFTNNGDLPVENNEFDNLFKLVRASHVKTDVHWTKAWKPTQLVDYKKYKWFGYEFLFTS